MFEKCLPTVFVWRENELYFNKLCILYKLFATQSSSVCLFFNLNCMLCKSIIVAFVLNVDLINNTRIHNDNSFPLT
uniref:Uncharacterized protein n=1 Tax=Anguilla anguilla TaxID=7936 RepID=A0A0E9WS29_ANGAN